MNIEIEDKLNYRGALLHFQKTWIADKLLKYKTISATAKLAGLTRKGLQLMLKRLSTAGTNDGKYLGKEATCAFCKSTEDIRLHHVDGKGNSDETICLCQVCHMKFHSLNKRFKAPPLRE